MCSDYGRFAYKSHCAHSLIHSIEISNSAIRSNKYYVLLFSVRVRCWMCRNWLFYTFSIFYWTVVSHIQFKMIFILLINVWFQFIFVRNIPLLIFRINSIDIILFFLIADIEIWGKFHVWSTCNNWNVSMFKDRFSAFCHANWAILQHNQELWAPNS